MRDQLVAETLPHKTEHSTENIYDPGRRAAVDLHLRLCGYWNQQVHIYIYTMLKFLALQGAPYIYIYI
jgi:hypothetical protein